MKVRGITLMVMPTGTNSADVTVDGFDQWRVPITWVNQEGKEFAISCAKYALKKKIENEP